MSAHIKRQIDIVKDNIYFIKRERDELYYEVYVSCHERWLPQYEFTLKGLDEQYDELEWLEKKYCIELRKERCKRADEERKQTFDDLISQVKRLMHLENEKKVKQTNEVEHIEGVVTEDSIEEVKQVTEDPIEAVKQIEHIEVASEEQLKETTPPDCFQIVEDHKVVDEIIEIEHIDFIIPEYLSKSQSLAYQFSKFFAPRPCFMKRSNFILVPSHHSCIVLDFYKTRGRVFSNKGRMMRNGNKQLIYILLISLYLFSVETNNVFVYMFYMWG